MKKQSVWSIAGIVLAATLLKAEPSAWKYVDGRTVKGEFVRLIGSNISIRTGDGTITLPLARLDEASQALARQLASGAVTASNGATGNGPAEAPATGTGTAPAAGAAVAMTDAQRQAVGLPTDAEIAKFQKSAQLPGRPEKYEFHAAFMPATVPEGDKKKYARNGKVPFRVTVELNEVKIVDGKPLSRRMDGRAGIFVMNSAGEIIDRVKESLGKLCPS